jgi:cobalamin synthase
VNFLESKVEQASGVVLGVFSLLMLFVVIPLEISADKGIGGVSPQFFPQLVVLLLLVCAISTFVTGYLKRNKPNQKNYTITVREAKLVAVSLLLLAIYITAFDWFGYMIPTMAALLVFMYVFGQRKKKLLGLISLGAPVLIYLFFTKVLQMPLP